LTNSRHSLARINRAARYLIAAVGLLSRALLEPGWGNSQLVTLTSGGDKRPRMFAV